VGLRPDGDATDRPRAPGRTVADEATGRTVTRIVRKVVLNDVATSEQTGTVGEPTIAVSGKRIMIAGNWYASRSTDGGSTWRFIDPFTEFPSAAGGFCCDQLVHYCASRRIWIWLLQYGDVDGANIVRIAVSRTGAPGTWTWWDIAPTDIDPSWTRQWFDYPDMAESDDQLWISFNMFDRFDRWQRALVFTIPLDDLTRTGNLTRRSWPTTEVGSIRFTQGAGDTMWFASHSTDNRELRVFSWADGATSVREWAVPIRPWNEDGYSSVGPGNGEWLARADGRITAGWHTDGVIGFAWCASPEAGRPHPYIRAARIDTTTLQLIDEPDLWSLNGAYAYPAACPNRRGDIGLTACFGGPTHPAHVVAHLQERTRTWHASIVATSTHAPMQGKWGDYLSIRADPTRATYWLAAGFVLSGGRDRRNVEPQVVTFAP
jgi:hypothetical protein